MTARKRGENEYFIRSKAKDGRFAVKGAISRKYNISFCQAKLYDNLDACLCEERLPCKLYVSMEFSQLGVVFE